MCAVRIAATRLKSWPAVEPVPAPVPCGLDNVLQVAFHRSPAQYFLCAIDGGDEFRRITCAARGFAYFEVAAGHAAHGCDHLPDRMAMARSKIDRLRLHVTLR